jgi:hypothetical protein
MESAFGNGAMALEMKRAKGNDIQNGDRLEEVDCQFARNY